MSVDVACVTYQLPLHVFIKTLSLHRSQYQLQKLRVKQKFAVNCVLQEQRALILAFLARNSPRNLTRIFVEFRGTGTRLLICLHRFAGHFLLGPQGQNFKINMANKGRANKGQ